MLIIIACIISSPINIVLDTLNRKTMILILLIELPNKNSELKCCNTYLKSDFI